MNLRDRILQERNERQQLKTALQSQPIKGTKHLRYELTYEEALSIFSYDPITGILTRIKNGKVVGKPNTLGYTEFRYKHTRFTVHRVAWLLTYGEWPQQVIDHINRDRSDNRLCNLRDVPPSTNIHNCNRPCKNSTGYTGVILSQNKKHFEAVITIEGNRVCLGKFPTAELAHEAYVKEKRAIGWT